MSPVQITPVLLFSGHEVVEPAALQRYYRVPVSTGTVRESFVPIGSNLPDFDNYFCRDCRRIVHVRKGSPGFRACPTPGCTRPTGFGAYAKTPIPLVRLQWRPEGHRAR